MLSFRVRVSEIRCSRIYIKSMRRDDSRMKKKKEKRYIKVGCTCVDENSLRGVNDECETAGWFNEDLN